MQKPAVFLLAVTVALGMVPPAVASPEIRQQERVETASRTLSRNLADQQAQQAELMRLQSVEWARVQNLFFPVALQPVLGQGSLDWLTGRSNPVVTGITPVSGRQGLLVGYTVAPNDALAFLAGRSFTYDNAVGSIAFLLQGQPESARNVLLALQRLMAPNGTLGFSYQVDSTASDARLRTGTLAWVGYAMALYQRVTGDRTFQPNAEALARYLKTLQRHSGSLKGGPDVHWISTEHNIDAYFFYRELYRVTGKSTYRTTSRQIRNSLLTNHWTGTSVRGRFLQGIGDSTPALDANSWGAIFLWAIGRNTQAHRALRYVESTFKTAQTIPGSVTQVTGYAPDSARRTVWLEGTLGVAAAHQRLGAAVTAGGIFGNVQKVQSAWQTQGKWHGALPYAFPRYLNADGDTYSDLESVASTGWLLIAQSVQKGLSPFWDKN